MSASCRRRENFEEGAEILRRLFDAQFPKLDGDAWLAAARRTWQERDGRLVPTYDVQLARTLEGIDIERPLPALWKEFDALRAVPLMVHPRRQFGLSCPRRPWRRCEPRRADDGDGGGARPGPRAVARRACCDPADCRLRRRLRARRRGIDAARSDRTFTRHKAKPPAVCPPGVDCLEPRALTRSGQEVALDAERAGPGVLILVGSSAGSSPGRARRTQLRHGASGDPCRAPAAMLAKFGLDVFCLL